MSSYEVLQNEKVVGSVTVTREGLYSRFRCVCTLQDAGIHKLAVHTNDRCIDLGVCVPSGSCFGLDTRIPHKKLGEGTLQFRILPARASAEVFVPVKTDGPFSYLQMLGSAHLEIRGEVTGVVLSYDGSVKSEP